MRIQTNYVRRFHLNVDPEARVIDCFHVSVLPAWELISQGSRLNVTIEMLWKEALESVERQQKSYRESGTWKHLKLSSPLDLQPFAFILATEEERQYVSRQVDIDILRYRCLDADPDADKIRKVQHLIRAWEGLHWLDVV